MALGHEVLLAGESILQGLSQWSGLAKWCAQARRPVLQVPRWASSRAQSARFGACALSELAFGNKGRRRAVL